MSYQELLKDVRWQTKRKAVLARDQYICQDCGASNILLNVHHKYYDQDLPPWEYPSDALITLCEDCHHNWDAMRKLSKDFFKPLLCSGWTPEDILNVVDELAYNGPLFSLKKLRNG
jgi:5-methylcytosine-specific restriction endonuclease McrA